MENYQMNPPWGKEASDLPQAPLSNSASSANATYPSAVIPQNRGTLPNWSCQNEHEWKLKKEQGGGSSKKIGLGVGRIGYGGHKEGRSGFVKDNESEAPTEMANNVIGRVGCSVT